MAKRLLPFRQYDEKDVVNLYAYDGAIASDPFTHGDNDEGVFVKVSNGNLNADVINYETSSYLGKTDYPHVGRNQYPTVPLKFVPATQGVPALGITLRQTLTHDENGEKLNYNPQKADELYAVLSGQAVPVATRGVFTISQDAVDGDLNVGDHLLISANAGKVTGLAPGAGFDSFGEVQGRVGKVLGAGSRVAINTADQFAGAAGSTGNYYMIQIDCA